MAISLKSTRGQSKKGGRVFLLYGPSGSGKTVSAATLDNPLILNSEHKLISLDGKSPITGEDFPDIPFVDVTTFAQVEQYIFGVDQGDEFNSVFVDSFSEVADLELAAALPRHKNGMQAYGEVGEKVFALLRKLRDVKRVNVVLVCRVNRIQDDTGKILWGPAMPGKAIGPQLPHYFEQVLASRVEVSGSETTRAFLTSTDGSWVANDCSGKLNQWEPPDLGAIIRKITG